MLSSDFGEFFSFVGKYSGPAGSIMRSDPVLFFAIISDGSEGDPGGSMTKALYCQLSLLKCASETQVWAFMPLIPCVHVSRTEAAIPVREGMT